MTLARRRRAARLLERGPRETARALRREARWRARTRTLERGLTRAARGEGPILVGPFVGELGFELLYWIPLLRRALRGVDPGRVTAFTRGGAAVWYGGVAGHRLEIFELMEPREFVERLREQRERRGDAKLLEVGALERELLRRAPVDGAAVIHPLLMYGRLRWAWFGSAPLASLDRHLEHRPLEPPPLPAGVELPDRFVALKAYFSRVFPDEGRNRDFLAQLVEQLGDVVLLTTGRELDDHDEWNESDGRLHRIDPFLTPESNLAVQTAVVARAKALVATYGGFSYLGPLLGVPTVAFLANDDHNIVHLEAARRYLGGRYEVAAADVEAVGRLLACEAETARA